MVDFRHLVEARIRDYNRRKEAGETRPAPDESELRSLEAMLISEIRRLRGQARSENDPEKKKALKDRGQALQTQLLVLLETTERPLAARLMAERLREEELECGDRPAR